jgi:hypothetical protein
MRDVMRSANKMLLRTSWLGFATLSALQLLGRETPVLIGQTELVRAAQYKQRNYNTGASSFPSPHFLAGYALTHEAAN